MRDFQNFNAWLLWMPGVHGGASQSSLCVACKQSESDWCWMKRIRCIIIVALYYLTYTGFAYSWHSAWTRWPSTRSPSMRSTNLRWPQIALCSPLPTHRTTRLDTDQRRSWRQRLPAAWRYSLPLPLRPTPRRHPRISRRPSVTRIWCSETRTTDRGRSTRLEVSFRISRRTMVRCSVCRWIDSNQCYPLACLIRWTRPWWRCWNQGWPLESSPDGSSSSSSKRGTEQRTRWRSSCRWKRCSGSRWCRWGRSCRSLDPGSTAPSRLWSWSLPSPSCWQTWPDSPAHGPGSVVWDQDTPQLQTTINIAPRTLSTIFIFHDPLSSASFFASICLSECHARISRIMKTLNLYSRMSLLCVHYVSDNTVI